MSRTTMVCVAVLVAVLGGAVTAQAPASLAKALSEAQAAVARQAKRVEDSEPYQELKRLQEHVKTLEALIAAEKTNSSK